MEHHTLAWGRPDPGNPPFRYRVRTRVEITDTDLGAVVYYARYPHFIDRAVVAYRRHLGIPPLGPEGHLFVVRRLTMDYLTSARFDEPLDVWVRTSALGRTSHTMQVRVANADDQMVRVDAELLLVGLTGYEDGRPSRMPDPMVRAIREFEGEALPG